MIHNGEVCRAELLQWSCDLNPNRLIDRTQERIMELKRRTQTETVHTEVAGLTIELEKLFRDQAAYWRQRGKAAWMKDGDKNISYFHARATIRQQVNKIKDLQDRNGVWIQEKQEMEGVVDAHFRDMFQSSDPTEREIARAL